MGGQDNQIFHKLAFTNDLLKAKSNYSPVPSAVYQSPDCRAKRYNEDLVEEVKTRENSSKDSCMFEELDDGEYRITGAGL